MWNVKTINTDMPLYMAIAEALERDIRNGTLHSGERLPTQRELGKIIGVNVSTVTRAYKYAEKLGIITSTVGSGTFVSSDLGINPSLMNPVEEKEKLIEMGLISPLYCVEPNMKDLLLKIVNQTNVNSFMRYISPRGLYAHRQTGARWLKKFGLSASPDNVIMTAGAQHAILCIMSSVFEPGDRVAVDCLTYPGIKTAAKRCGVRLEAVLMDNEGMMPKSLDALCKRYEIKGIYTVSDMQNPTNSKMSEKRRLELAKVIKSNRLVLVEDDLYRFLSNDIASTLSALLPEQSIYVAGLSKAFYAGLRIAFVLSPDRFYNKIVQAIVDTIWMSSQLSAEIACRCIETGLADKIIELKKAEFDRRADLFFEKTKEYESKYTPHSMFVWLKLPDDWNFYEFERLANEGGINIITSNKFTVGNIVPPNYVRISLSGANSLAELERGLDILTRTINREAISLNCLI